MPDEEHLGIRQAIKAALTKRPTATSGQIARAVLRLVPADELVDFVFPLVVMEVDHERRATMRHLEDTAARLAWAPTRSHRAPLDSRTKAVVMSARDDFLAWRDGLRAATFKLDGKIIRWWDATVEQLETRRDRYDVLIAGCARARDNITKTLDVLKSTGARCLAEITDQAA